MFYTRENIMSPNDRLQELLVQLQSKDAATRTNAATDLGMLGMDDTKVETALSRSLQSDESSWVRRAAVKALAKLRSPNAVSALRSALHDRDKWVVHSASEALRRYFQVDA